MDERTLRLEDLQWLRALAARLVRDPHAADDAVQNTLVAALEGGPSEPSALRAWLAAALRNFLRTEWRARARRSAREAAVSTPRQEPSTLELVEELALHRRLADEVHALEEPYRTAILLRYLRARSSAEIARELGVPVKTVRTRLERGLAKLRARLGRDRDAWGLVLLGIVPSVVPRAAAPILWPALLVSMKVKLVASVVALSLVGYFVLHDASRERAGSEAAQALAPSSPVLPVDPAPPAEGLRELRTGAAPEPAGSPASARTKGPPLRGFVRTLDGEGLAGVEVVLEQLRGERFESAQESPRARSGPGGGFELALEEPRGRLNVLDDHLTAVVRPRLEGALPLAEPILVVAPRRVYAGRVVDPAGVPIPRARVELTLDGPSVQSRDVGGTSVHLLLPFAEASGDEHGDFRLDSAPYVAGALLDVRAEGFESWRGALPPESHEHLELVLLPSSTPRWIHGVVLEPTGVPATLARVSLGSASTGCEEDGSFVLECEESRTDGWLRAVQSGHLPAEVALPEALVSTARHPLVLTLGRAPLAIRGRLLDESGSPVAGAAVFTPDTTPFGSVEFQESAHSIAGLTTVEAYLAGRTQHPGEGIHSVTGADGSFALEGLLERSYAVFALDARTLDGLGPVLLRAGGSSAELRLPRAQTVPVAGRVLSRSGQPLAGVNLRLGREFGWQAEEGEGSRWSGFPLRAPQAAWCLEVSAVTDVDGTFGFGSLVTRGAFLALSGEALALGARFELAAAPDPGALEVVVDAASRFQIVPRLADGADAFALERPGGEEVVLFLEVEGLKITALRATIDGGRSGIVLAHEGEYEVVLYAGGQEVQREPVRLLPGGVHEVTP